MTKNTKPAAPQPPAEAAQSARADPMDWPLPCDVKVGHGTIRKGVALRTLVTRMKVLYEMATGENADRVASRTPEERVALFADFQRTLAAAQPATAPVVPAGHVPGSDDYLQGVCVALQLVKDRCEVTWREIVRAVGERDLLEYAALVEPEEWELAGFDKLAMQELGKRKPKARRMLAAAPAAPVVPQPAAQQGEAVAWMDPENPRDPIGADKKRDLETINGAPGRALAAKYTVALHTTPPARQAVAPEAPAAAMPYEPTEEMRLAAKRIDPAMTHEQIRALWSVMWSAAPKSAARQAVALTDADAEELWRSGRGLSGGYIQFIRAIERAVWQANGITPAQPIPQR